MVHPQVHGTRMHVSATNNIPAKTPFHQYFNPAKQHPHAQATAWQQEIQTALMQAQLLVWTQCRSVRDYRYLQAVIGGESWVFCWYLLSEITGTEITANKIPRTHRHADISSGFALYTEKLCTIAHLSGVLSVRHARVASTMPGWPCPL